jgi:hypothetical protein
MRIRAHCATHEVEEDATRMFGYTGTMSKQACTE